MFWIVLVLVVSLVCGDKTACPGGEHQCPDSATCCQLPDKTYGCCPLKNAVCCNDNIHCCPENSKCDAGMCVQGKYLNATAHKLTSEAQNKPCPTEESSCPDNYTCCSNTRTGVFGCCPLQDAVCCVDGAHCCPRGTVCDLVMDRCIGKNYAHQMYDPRKKSFETKHRFEAIVMKAKIVASVVCPGSEFQCPDGYTCCQLPNGSWGCCPFVNATCCNDHMHCCPQNLKCDTTSQSCLQGSTNVTWSLNKLAIRVSEKDVVCPDERHCPEDTTCCQLESGHYGCCSYADAVCCSDHLHCCPSGYDCDVHKRQCLHGHDKLHKILPQYESNDI